MVEDTEVRDEKAEGRNKKELQGSIILATDIYSRKSKRKEWYEKTSRVMTLINIFKNIILFGQILTQSGHQEKFLLSRIP